MHDDTLAVTAGRTPEAHGGAVNPPVYRVSTVLHGSLAELGAARAARLRDEQQMVYGRIGTPTHFALENAVAALEGGYRAVALPSGLAAVAAALGAFCKSGDHVLIGDNVYEPTRRFADGVLRRQGVAVEYFDPLAGAGLRALTRPNTSVVFAESPGSLTFEVGDMPALAEAAHATSARLIIDNTWGTPLYFKPFAHGVDVSVQAATKYIVGHSDAMLGTCAATREAWPTLIDHVRRSGLTAGPDDVYLAHRGLRTLPVRLARHMQSGLAIAEWLRGRREIARVLHPALPGDPGHALWRRDFLGACGLFAIELQPCSEAAVAAFVDGLELFGIGASWGGYESLILPQHPEKCRTATQWSGRGPLLRLHIGLEAVEDLKADLAAGFERLKTAF